MPARQSIWLPEQYTLNYKVRDNPIQQLRRRGTLAEAEVREYNQGRVSGSLYVTDKGERTLVVSGKLTAVDSLPGVDEVLLTGTGLAPAAIEADIEPYDEAQLGQWLKPSSTNAKFKNLARERDRCERVRTSWQNRVVLREEDRSSDPPTKGLRSAQVGGIYAALAHWKVTGERATIVMPTGTGKTETMVALLVHEQFERLLVVVPTDTLRSQIARKFLTLGVLKNNGVIGAGAQYPVVGKLEHRPRTPEEVEDFFLRCNVVVTTMSVAGQSASEVQDAMAQCCSHLIIDEAHHIRAETWEGFRGNFENKVILQFTATPFRNDRKHIDGRVIFNYPLRLAQRDECFQEINFQDVYEVDFTRSDAVIASAAIRQLKLDRNRNLDHILLARTASIAKAEQIHSLYKERAPEFDPVLVHSNMKAEERRNALRKIHKRESRIIVCVDMFGEGFDLPELKIAALHDLHKSLAVTLQFVGRFARTVPNIGTATVIANSLTADVDAALEELYAEDADWDKILRNLSEKPTQRQQRLSEFLGGFETEPGDIPVQNILPKMSTVVYRTRCKTWHPQQIKDVIDESIICSGPILHRTQKVFFVITKESEPIDWANYREIANTTWNLYLLHWDTERNLLFINSSNRGSLHEDLARAVAGKDVERVSGEVVFRALHNIKRILFMNVGLNSALGQALSYSMHTGSNVREALSSVHLQDKLKSNLFGRGFENGKPASIGCSHHGRIWSHKIAESIEEWMEWCHAVGDKLLNDSISFEETFEDVLIYQEINDRPGSAPIAVEWPSEFWEYSEESLQLNVDGDTASFYDVGLEIVEPSKIGPIRFRVFTDDKSVEYAVEFRKGKLDYVVTKGSPVTIIVRKRLYYLLTDRFREYSPIFRFENGGYLTNNGWVEPLQQRVTGFRQENIVAWDWTGVNIQTESQYSRYDRLKLTKRKDSVQYRVIQVLCAPTHDPAYDIVFDDDQPGEMADVVALKVMGERLLVHLYHCKFSDDPHPGGRVSDLHVVCGQAQSSGEWSRKKRVEQLFDHLIARENGRQAISQNKSTRFEKGTLLDLHKIKRSRRRLEITETEFRIFIVQPGLSKARVSPDQLDLLGVTELYLKETSNIPLGVIASP